MRMSWKIIKMETNKNKPKVVQIVQPFCLLYQSIHRVLDLKSINKTILNWENMRMIDWGVIQK